MTDSEQRMNTKAKNYIMLIICDEFIQDIGLFQSERGVGKFGGNRHETRVTKLSGFDEQTVSCRDEIWRDGM